MSADRITTPFDAESTADDVINGIDLTGRRAVVTGASSGIGVETARALAQAGAEVTLAVRNVDAGATVAKQITADTGNDAVHVGPLDLSDLASVAEFVAAWSGPLHLLVNNAGIMSSPLARTPQGWEMQFATNHFGHFALATGLHDALAAEGARVVSLSSRGHHRCSIDFDDIHYDRKPYDADLAYGQSKTANVLFAVEATDRWAADGILVNAVHPGAILDTNLTRYYNQEDLAEVIARNNFVVKTVEQGAATTVLVATSALLDGIGGRYFEDCNQALPHTEGMDGGVMAWALDPQAAGQLWEVSTDAVGRR
jgi:NAD(P)-dependent dehydrogenase (short-subunit alcohol dehydrogenase family)